MPMMSGDALLQAFGLRQAPAHKLIFNPFQAAPGGKMKIDWDWCGDFSRIEIKAIIEYTRPDEDNAKCTDYECLGFPPGGGSPQVFRVRVNERNNDDRSGNVDVLVMRLFHEMEYAKDFEDVVRDPNGGGIFRTPAKGDEPELEYLRIGGLTEPHYATLKILTDKNADGKIDVATEVARRALNYWDYGRNGQDEGGTFEEFCFAEIDTSGPVPRIENGRNVGTMQVKGTGWTQVWKARRVPASRISVY